MNRIKRFIKQTVLSILGLENARKMFKTVSDPLNANQQITFSTPTDRLDSRANSLADKEPGTIAWLDNTLQPSDIFYDIGANVGIYTLFSANRISKEGKVFAFEPHAPNFNTLIENIMTNDKADRVMPLSFALGDSDSVQPFLYKNVESGSSGSQLSESPISDSKDMHEKAELTELKASYSIDGLISKKIISAPNLIKIDVDGNELNIVKGMTKLLKSKNKPRSIQIEVDPTLKKEVVGIMESSGYGIDHIHFTKKGQRLVDAGQSPDSYPHNIVFKPNK